MTTVFKTGEIFAMDILVGLSVVTLVLLNFVDSAIDNGGGCVYNFEVNRSF